MGVGHFPWWWAVILLDLNTCTWREFFSRLTIKEKIKFSKYLHSYLSPYKADFAKRTWLSVLSPLKASSPHCLEGAFDLAFSVDNMMHVTQTSKGYKRVCWEEGFPPSWLPKPPLLLPQGKHHCPLLLVILDSVLQATTTDRLGLTGEIKRIGHAGQGEPGQGGGWAEGALLAYSGGSGG